MVERLRRMERDDSTATYLGIGVGLAVGIGLGALFFRQPPERDIVPPVQALAAPVEVPRPALAGTLKATEEMFERWGGYAVWEDDVTEIALWNHARQRHADFYEVRRANGEFYFRTLRVLNRPIVDHGVRTRLPIAFTEPAWMREKFYRENPGYVPGSEPAEEVPPRPPERRDAPNSRPIPRPGGVNVPVAPGG